MSAGMKFVQREPVGPLLIVISLGSQTVDVHDSQGRIASAPISSGRRDYETPEGVFSIIEKREEHYSNLYDDAHMPFMQRITWSGVALHQGPLPGRAASHGCVRLPGGFAEWLFKQTRIDTRVLVTPHRPTPVDVVHAALPYSNGAATAAAAQPSNATAASPDAVAPAASLRSLAERRQAAADTLAKARAMSAAYLKAEKAVKTSKEAAGSASESLEAAERTLARASKRVADARGLLDKASVVGPRRKRMEAALDNAAQIESGARTALDKARAKGGAPIEAVTKAKAALDAIGHAKIAAWKAAGDARRNAAPISVLISRKQGKLYLRQGFEPVAEFPFRLAEPERPVGTHVFMVRADAGDGKSLSWVAATVEDPSFPRRKVSETTGKLGPLKPTGEIDQHRLATAVLDRLTLPADALLKIVPSLQPGSTVIVSDRGPSPETGKGTDFVILTNPEPDFWVPGG